MTLRLIIKNDGNQPGDQAVLRGVKVHMNGDEPVIDSEGRKQISLRGTGYLNLGQGEEVIVYPECGHFGDFDRVEIKGKH